MQNPGLGIAKSPRHARPEQEGGDQNLEALLGKPLHSDLQPRAWFLEFWSPDVRAEVAQGPKRVQTPQCSAPTSTVVLVTCHLLLWTG